MVLKVSWIKILFIKLTNSTKHSILLAKTGIEVHLLHEFMPSEPFLFSSNEHAQSTTLETHVFGGFAAFRRRTQPIAETRIGVHLIECLGTVGL